jgi:hypothetical protein
MAAVSVVDVPADVPVAAEDVELVEELVLVIMAWPLDGY